MALCNLPSVMEGSALDEKHFCPHDAPPSFTQDVLRHALGLGADSALHVVSDQELQPLAVARCLAALSKQHQIGLALLGKQAIDDDCNQTVRHSTSGQGGGGCALFLLDPGHGYDPRCCCQTQGQMLSALLGWPQATFASKLEVRHASHGCECTRP